jgi:hypothetical protein
MNGRCLPVTPVNTEEETQISEYWSTVNFFSGQDIFRHPELGKIGAAESRSEGPAAASNFDKDRDFGGRKEESRMFSAIARFRAGPTWSRIVSRTLEGANNTLV